MGIDMERKGEIVGDLDWDGLHRPRIYYAMVATFSGLFLAVLDGTICNVALPSISEDLQVSSSDSIWIINAFQLVIMMSLLPFSSLGELFGYKRIYLFGVAVFTVGSLFCSLTATLPLLVVARVFQGIGAAMIMSVNTSLVRIIYPSEAAFGKRRGPECDGRRHSFGSRPYIGGGYFVGSLLAVAFCH